MVKDIDETNCLYNLWITGHGSNKIVDIPSVDKYTCLNASFETNKRIAD